MDTSILIVDDDDAIRNTAEEFLEYSGYSTVSTSSAEDALAILKVFQPDIVLTDISMQGMNGLELTRLIKDRYPVEVIVMTGYIAEHSYEEAVNAGASDFIFKPFRFEELHLRIKRVIKEMNLKRRNAEMIKKLEELAVTDGLTGLYNQRHFYDQLNTEIERHMRYHAPLSLMLFDIDCFKQFNDTYGHIEGDKVIVSLAKVTKSCMRSLDTAYRYGGEEFTVILPETDLRQAAIVGERLRATFEQERFHPAQTLHAQIPASGLPANMHNKSKINSESEELLNNATNVNENAEKTSQNDHAKITVSSTISIGVTQFTKSDTITTFIKRADMAMYKSKDRGRNRLTTLPALPQE
ncbi:Signal transduction family protein (GGDEF domain protein) [Desulfamplus magnetovallimortis]|uniref:diguanylate cyclase n=1 Tax=Desulfamplus magnetovallimortis TaxID=1246637 RepID=A0A1W1HBT5_9BACT|nr:diguanylate cyclase [Desulfamplus magnetovallimortis]SLM29896.1 Signal transduction family protein (GGDEF domain protein) [Desulfamplus magnetovallimortis]